MWWWIDFRGNCGRRGKRQGFPGGASCKEPSCHCGSLKRCGLDPWIRKIPWKRAWQPTPVLLPGESMERRAGKTAENVANTVANCQT